VEHRFPLVIQTGSLSHTAPTADSFPFTRRTSHPLLSLPRKLPTSDFIDPVPRAKQVRSPPRLYFPSNVFARFITGDRPAPRDRGGWPKFSALSPTPPTWAPFKILFLFSFFFYGVASSRPQAFPGRTYGPPFASRPASFLLFFLLHFPHAYPTISEEDSRQLSAPTQCIGEVPLPLFCLFLIPVLHTRRREDTFGIDCWDFITTLFSRIARQAIAA